MRDSGLAHLLAISGLHLGLVAGLVFATVRLGLAAVPAVALRFPIKKWAAVAAALGAFGYLLLAGATVPTQRAFVMVLASLVAVLLDRQPISLRLVAFAATVVLLLRPESLLTPGFQMSFAAVMALVAGFEAWTRRRRREEAPPGGLASRVGRYLAALLLSSAIATIATAPFALFNFDRLAIYGLLANMVAVPLTGFWIMPWALLALVAMPFGLEAWPLLAAGWGVEAVLRVAEAVAAWPGAVLEVPAAPVWGLGSSAFGLAWLCLWSGRWRLLGLAGPALGLLALILARPPDLLVSADRNLHAVSEPDGALLISSTRREKFASDIWRRRTGSDRLAPLPEPGESVAGLVCGPLGCVLTREGWKVAIGTDPRAQREDCMLADLVVSFEPLPPWRCPDRRVIDRFDLWRGGTHALWLAAEGIRVESVAAYRGQRPWVRPR